MEISGKKFHKMDNELGKKEATEERRKLLENKLNVELKNIGHYSLDPERAIGRNIENMIGVAQIPLGVAGPLKINGKEFILPLATTEGTLVASVNRGCRAIGKAGGAFATVYSDFQTRGPLFKVKNIKEALKFKEWLENNFEKVKEVADSTSNHLKFETYYIYNIGTNIFVRFMANTSDAMGMNMITVATQKVCEFIEKETGAKFAAVSGNACIDKKPAAINTVLGRGKTTGADVLIPGEIVKDVLKTTPEAFVDINTRKNLLGSAVSQSLGFNAHFANILKALFNATGQDLAHVVDGSMGITWAEVQEGDLYISVTIPDLQVGTVGGGTGLPTQKEALSILGVKTGKEFAEVVTAAVLAGEISLIAAIASNQLTGAHEKHGR